MFRHPHVLLKVHILLLAINTVICFPPTDTLSLFIFKNVSATYPTRNNHGLSLVVLLSKTRVPRETDARLTLSRNSRPASSRGAPEDAKNIHTRKSNVLT